MVKILETLKLSFLMELALPLVFFKGCLWYRESRFEVLKFFEVAETLVADIFWF